MLRLSCYFATDFSITQGLLFFLQLQAAKISDLDSDALRGPPAKDQLLELTSHLANFDVTSTVAAEQDW